MTFAANEGIDTYFFKTTEEESKMFCSCASRGRCEGIIQQERMRHSYKCSYIRSWAGYVFLHPHTIEV